MPHLLPAPVPLESVGQADTSLTFAVLGHRLWPHQGVRGDAWPDTQGGWWAEEWKVVSERVWRDCLELSSQVVVNIGEEGGGGWWWETWLFIQASVAKIIILVRFPRARGLLHPHTSLQAGVLVSEGRQGLDYVIVLSAFREHCIHMPLIRTPYCIISWQSTSIVLQPQICTPYCIFNRE